MAYEDYESVIGLEIHAQLKTQSKMFCGCSTRFQALENENICPVCTGMPGALPVVNKNAVQLAMKIGLALNCNINKKSVFARKNYFYPDLPKGYQISQFEEPLCEGGWLEFYVDGERKKINITRAHMEEDAGKLVHQGENSLVNYNRSSVPLLEIVSEPELRSPQEAAEYAKMVRSILVYLEACDGNLEEGSMRCDCNVSVRKRGVTELGTRAELKNINSFRFIEKAIQFEIERQIDLIESGESVIQETRLYDSDKNKTYSMRSKEEAHDYRYFPEPDLMDLRVDSQWIEKCHSELPELPLEKVDRYQKDYGLPEYDAFVLTQTKEMASYFETVAQQSKNAKAASNWVMGELQGRLNESKKEISESNVKPEMLSKLIKLIDKNVISGKMAKSVFLDMFESGKDPSEIIESKGLKQISDPKEVEKIIDEIILKNASQVEAYRAGKDKLFGFFVGQAMKLTKGQANPQLVNQVLKEKLK